MIAELEHAPTLVPCLLLAESNEPQADRHARTLRRFGWDVYVAQTGPEARRLAAMLAPDLVVLATDLRDESGWLTCAKLSREVPDLPLLLHKANATATDQAFARFVGARGLIDSPNLLADPWSPMLSGTSSAV